MKPEPPAARAKGSESGPGAWPRRSGAGPKNAGSGAKKKEVAILGEIRWWLGCGAGVGPVFGRRDSDFLRRSRALPILLQNNSSLREWAPSRILFTIDILGRAINRETKVLAVGCLYRLPFIGLLISK